MSEQVRTTITPVIMSGGSGTRLWPLSTEALPKQFHSLGAGDLSLFQQTVQRTGGEAAFLPPIVICNARHELLVREQLDALGVAPAAIVTEPFGRNTAAVGAVAASVTQSLHPGSATLLLPADHLIPDAAAFRDTVLGAGPLAAERIITFGIAPTRPETGYGYIAYGALIEGSAAYDVLRFVEKPTLEVAQGYLDHGGYLWNGGIFLFAPAVLLSEMSRWRPDIVDASLAALAEAARDNRTIALQPETFARVPSESIDFAVMEKTARMAVAPFSAGWTDIGSWAEVWEQGAEGQSANAVRGDVTLLDSDGSLVWSDGLPVAVLGVKDLVVIATAEGVLVLPKSRSQEVKRLLEARRKSG